MEHTDEQRGGEDTTTQRLGEPKDVADGHDSCCLIALRISSMRRVRHANLVHPSRKTARKIAAPLARIKTDLIKCTESPKSDLTDSDALITLGVSYRMKI
jgi:hypothetical protein